MDPLTAGLNLANTIVQGALDIFKALPQPQQATVATDIINLLKPPTAFLTSVQDKIAAAVATPAK